jgi:hypothetical protein
MSLAVVYVILFLTRCTAHPLYQIQSRPKFSLLNA